MKYINYQQSYEWHSFLKQTKHNNDSNKRSKKDRGIFSIWGFIYVWRWWNAGYIYHSLLSYNLCKQCNHMKRWIVYIHQYRDIFHLKMYLLWARLLECNHIHRHRDIVFIWLSTYWSCTVANSTLHFIIIILFLMVVERSVIITPFTGIFG